MDRGRHPAWINLTTAGYLYTMELTEAIDLIRPAVGDACGTWADLGAGRGLFSRALLDILDGRGRVVAVDRDPAAVRALRRSVGSYDPTLEAAVGDFRDMDAIDALEHVRLDGALFANALHYVRTPEEVLTRLSGRLRAGARLVVVEYEGRAANPWVPYPLPRARLSAVAVGAGYDPPAVVGRRPSAYQGEMYCAVTTWSGEAGRVG